MKPEALKARRAALAEKVQQIDARIRRIEARERAKAQKLERAKDTRRKILVGAMLLEQTQRDPTAAETLTRRLDAYLTRPDDRELFGLPPRPQQAAQ